MPYTTHNIDALTGGAARALDSYAIAGLTDGDRAAGAIEGEFLYFKFNSSSTDAENIATHPYRVRPDDYGAGPGVWEEQKVVHTRVVVVKCLADDTTLSVADGIMHFTIPIELNGMNLVSVGAHVYTVSSSGLPTFMIYNLTDSSNMLSTAITIDETENDSKDADTPAVIDESEDDVVTGDVLRFDCTTAGTDTEGMEIRMGFRLP